MVFVQITFTEYLCVFVPHFATSFLWFKMGPFLKTILHEFKLVSGWCQLMSDVIDWRQIGTVESSGVEPSTGKRFVLPTCGFTVAIFSRGSSIIFHRRKFTRREEEEAAVLHQEAQRSCSCHTGETFYCNSHDNFLPDLLLHDQHVLHSGLHAVPFSFCYVSVR